MSNWFGSKPECPVDPNTREWIEERWGWLTEQFGGERLRTARVILPTPEFFPDTWTGTADDARQMLDRVCGYIGIAPETVELSLYQDCNPVYDGGLRQGTAGLYHEEDGRFRIWIEASNLSDPLALVATMAHELGHVHLLGHGRVSPDTEDHEPLTDLLTVFLGLGLFSANSVIRENYWDAGAVSGWSIGRRGYLTMSAFGYALALFARTRGEMEPDWANGLRADVRSAFKQASCFLAQANDRYPALTNVGRNPLEAPPSEWNVAEPDKETVSSTALNVQELLHRYARGERDFRNIDLQGLSLCKVDLRGTCLAGADLNGADFSDAWLTGTDLRDADIQLALMQRANLRNANLNGADLSGANLSGADLTGADIRNTDFTGGSLDCTILVGTLRNSKTNMRGIDLTRVVCDMDLTKEDLSGTMLLDVFVIWHDWVRICFGALFFSVFGALVGGLFGTLLGSGVAMIQHVPTKPLADGIGIPAAFLFALFGAWRFLRSRALNRAKDPKTP